SHPLGRNCPGTETDRISFASGPHESADRDHCSSRHARTQRVNADDACAVLTQLAEPLATHDKLTSNDPFLFRIARFCHAISRLSVTCKPRFEGSERSGGHEKCRHRSAIIPMGLSSPR